MTIIQQKEVLKCQINAMKTVLRFGVTIQVI